MSIVEFIPGDVEPWFAALLVFASFFTSAMTAAFGIGGGLALMAIMATGAPIASVVPAHGVVQLGSNIGRAILQRAYIAWSPALWFCAGGLVGTAVGASIIAPLPEAPLKVTIGAFILYFVWGPKPAGMSGSTFAITANGALGGALTMFVGATGPFAAAALLPLKLDRRVHVATFSICMSAQHIAKIIAFLVLGFAFADWLALMAAMIITGFLGTVVGVHVLHRLSERMFRHGLRVLLTVLAANLVVSALLALRATNA